MAKLTALAASMLCLACPPAPAEVVQSSADGALIQHRFQVAAIPSDAWSVLVHPERWWPADHTWSGDPSYLRLNAQAGGCFCENWGENSAEHGRVVMALPGQLLRIRGSLGPLQEMAVTGVLTIKLAAKDTGTEATVTYRLSGDASHKLDAFIPAVDKVLGQQFGSFARYASQPGLKPSL
jgi:uncharacterized protein YndB with AHSA1/START domain